MFFTVLQLLLFVIVDKSYKKTEESSRNMVELSLREAEEKEAHSTGFLKIHFTILS